VTQHLLAEIDKKKWWNTCHIVRQCKTWRTHTSKSKCDTQLPCSITRTYQYRKAMLQFLWHSSHRNIWRIPSSINFVFHKYFMVSPHPAQPYLLIFCLAWCCLSPSFSILQLIDSCHCSFHYMQMDMAILICDPQGCEHTKEWRISLTGQYPVSNNTTD